MVGDGPTYAAQAYVLTGASLWWILSPLVANTAGWPNCDCLVANWSFTLVDPITTLANTVGWPNFDCLNDN